MGTELLPPFVLANYEVHEWKHACAILKQDFPGEWKDLCELLMVFRLRRSWINTGGGRKSKVSENIDSFLYARGWTEKKFDTQIVVDGNAKQSPTHKVDCFKNRVAIEIEWNNKDPFFDRDLNNFRLLSPGTQLRLPSPQQRALDPPAAGVAPARRAERPNCAGASTASLALRLWPAHLA